MEESILRKLRKNKNWKKVSTHIKFRNVIRLIVRKQRKDPNFLLKKFKVFKIVDQLYEGRMARVINLKKILAR